MTGPVVCLATLGRGGRYAPTYRATGVTDRDWQYGEGMVRKLPEDAMLVVLTRRVGFRKAMKVLTFVIAWAIVLEDLAVEDITIEDYAAWWRTSERTAFREQALFRESMPDEDSPTRIARKIRGKVDVNDKAAPALLGTMNLAI